MTTYTPSQLPSVEWKPCTFCYQIEDVHYTKKGIPILKCMQCHNSLKEPVEMENPIVDQFYYGDEGDFETVYKYQVGVEFEDECMACGGSGAVDIGRGEPPVKCDCNLVVLKFLPLRQKVEGDNSVLMVVKNG